MDMLFRRDSKGAARRRIHGHAGGDRRARAEHLTMDEPPRRDIEDRDDGKERHTFASHTCIYAILDAPS